MTSPNIPAIDTIYKGHRFRSRTEAKWAVFFDLVEVPYEYEPQGVDLPSGKYLPDFWLPTHEAWFEVKGTWEAARSDLRKYAELCARSQHVVVVAVDIPQAADQVFLVRPKPSEYKGLTWGAKFEDVEAFIVLEAGRFWCEGQRLSLVYPAPRLLANGYLGVGLKSGEGDGPGECRPCDHELREAGYARFEHGENGARGHQRPWSGRR